MVFLREYHDWNGFDGNVNLGEYQDHSSQTNTQESWHLNIHQTPCKNKQTNLQIISVAADYWLVTVLVTVL